MSVYAANLIINRGTDFDVEFIIKDNNGYNFDLTNYTVVSKIRKHRESENFISFTVSVIDRPNGVIKLSLPRWISTQLKSGRFVYDVVAINSSNVRTVVLEGDILVEGLISQSCTFVLPTSAERLCIAVIDENSETSAAGMETLWTQFRSTYPNRIFYLLQPTGSFGTPVNNNNYDTLACPDNFLNETTVNVPPLI